MDKAINHRVQNVLMPSRRAAIAARRAGVAHSKPVNPVEEPKCVRTGSREALRPTGELGGPTGRARVNSASVTTLRSCMRPSRVDMIPGVEAVLRPRSIAVRRIARFA